MHQNHGSFAVTSSDLFAQEKNLNIAFTQTRNTKQLLLERLSYPMPTQQVCNPCCSVLEMPLFYASDLFPHALDFFSCTQFYVC